MSYCRLLDRLTDDRKNLHKTYHDQHYGFPIHDNNELFCRLVPEINQAGLSWETILKKQCNCSHTEGAASSYIERTLRLAMKKKNVKTLPIYPEGRGCKSPTMFDLVRLFKDVERYEVTQSEETAIYPAKLEGIQKEILKLLDVPLSRYQ